MNDDALKEKLKKVLPYLNEKQQRIFAATEAMSLGYGGISKVARLTGFSRTTIHKGIQDAKIKDYEELEKIRLPGGGRKSTHFRNKKVRKAIDDLVEDSTRGDPMSPLKWTSKSIRHIAEVLSKKGIEVSRESVRAILKDLGYSLRANDESLEDSHPDRDEQFRYISKRVNSLLRRGLPVISVDTKKKELIGNFANKGTEWRKKDNPRKVKGHDFHGEDQEIGIPYGIYVEKRFNIPQIQPRIPSYRT